MTEAQLPNLSAGVTGMPWTQAEIDLTVAAYFEMWAMQFAGQRYRKVDTVRRLAALMPARSSRALEAKFQNVSAVLAEFGIGWIEGYKPWENYQGALRDSVMAWISGPAMIRQRMEVYQSSALVAASTRPQATEDVLVAVPGASQLSGKRRTTVAVTGGPDAALVDFRKRELGEAGERWVLDLERESLRRVGRPDLAEKVKWAAREVGDGLGYDVLSYRSDGADHLIEVKTTNLGPRTPFYITRGEVDVSRSQADVYSLYRVHGFARDPRIYVLDGNVEERAHLEPKVFLGIPI